MLQHDKSKSSELSIVLSCVITSLARQPFHFRFGGKGTSGHFRQVLVVWLARPSHLTARGVKGKGRPFPALSAPAIRWDGLASQTNEYPAKVTRRSFPPKTEVERLARETTSSLPVRPLPAFTKVSCATQRHPACELRNLMKVAAADHST